jgi:hypothetical protein
MTHLIVVAICPNHKEMVCLGISLDGVAYPDVPVHIWMLLLQSPYARVGYQLCPECRAKVKF